MNKISKKMFMRTHIETLASDVLNDIVNDISMQKEMYEPDLDVEDPEQTEYIISITVEERK